MHHACAGAFSQACEGTETGGFAKVPDAHPDPLHTYMSISGFALTAALLGQDSDGCVKGLCPSLGISLAALSPLLMGLPPRQCQGESPLP